MEVLMFILSIAYIASAVPILDEADYHYERFIQFPDDEGVLHLVDLEAEPDTAVFQKVSRNPGDHLYLLFTRRNPLNAQTLVYNDRDSILNSNFNPNVPTIVVVHGWNNDQTARLNPSVRDAYLAKSDVNVIIMDWGKIALSDYVTAAYSVPAVGQGLGQFITFLNTQIGVSYDLVHLVGFSLGAHVVGSAGREVGGKIARITGLDPAGPLWTLNSNRLAANDAIYVEAIHTDNVVGIGLPLADVDFFPNGGRSQPGCDNDMWCNHHRAWELFSATVTYNHLIGNECSSTLQVILNTCQGSTFNMGNDDLKKTGSGIYRLNTESNYPY